MAVTEDKIYNSLDGKKYNIQKKYFSSINNQKDYFYVINFTVNSKIIARLMKRYLTLKNVIIFILVTPIWVSSSIGLYEDRRKIQEKIRSYFPQTAVTEEKVKLSLIDIGLKRL